MYIHQVRTIVNEHTTQLQNELERKMERKGQTKEEVLLEDLFLAGKIYALGSLTLDLICAQEDESEHRDRLRSVRERESSHGLSFFRVLNTSYNETPMKGF
jgi:hypothetical protein